MPRKPPTVLVMRDDPPLSSKRWYGVVIAAVIGGVREITLQLAIRDPAEHAGREVTHRLPAVLTPNSQLGAFLRDGLVVEPAQGESFDLNSLVGRQLEIRLSQTEPPAAYVVTAVRPSTAGGQRWRRSAPPATGNSASKSPSNQETKDGLE